MRQTQTIRTAYVIETKKCATLFVAVIQVVSQRPSKIGIMLKNVRTLSTSKIERTSQGSLSVFQRRRTSWITTLRKAFSTTSLPSTCWPASAFQTILRWAHTSSIHLTLIPIRQRLRKSIIMRISKPFEISFMAHSQVMKTSVVITPLAKWWAPSWTTDLSFLSNTTKLSRYQRQTPSASATTSSRPTLWWTTPHNALSWPY